MQANGGDSRLSPLPRRVSQVSRFDRPTWLMKEGQAPLSTLTPWRKGQAPSSKPPPMGKGDGSLLPFPKPQSLSLSRRHVRVIVQRKPLFSRAFSELPRGNSGLSYRD